MDVSGYSRRAREHAHLLLSYVSEKYPDFRSELSKSGALQAVESVLGIKVHIVESVGAECSVAGSSDVRTRSISVVRASTERMAFTALHEVAHVEGEDAAQYQQALWNDMSRNRDIEEDACESFAASILLPEKTVDSVLGEHGRTAAGVKALWMAAPEASLEACAVATAQRLRSPGHVLITKGAGRLVFAARSGDEYPLRRNIDQAESDLRPLYRGANYLRDRGSLSYAGGSQTSTYFLDALRDGDLVIAVAVTDHPDWKVLHTPAPERYEDKMIEGYCANCATSFFSGVRCEDCTSPRHDDCGSCDCGSRPSRGALTCGNCRLEQPAHLFSQDPDCRVCDDCW